MFQPAYTVSQITDKIRALLENHEDLWGVSVEGEVSQFTRHAGSGHCYFNIKDNNASLRCVMWKTAADRQSFLPKQGDKIEVVGRITVYAPRGEYQLQVEKIRPVGAGDLYAQFERLKSQLAAEGLFDAARKKPLPVFPHTIGVVTSATAAAFQDIQNVLRRRFPLAHVILSSAAVQGTEAPPQIVRAIERLNAYGKVDVILLIRGGGSIEDLWAFNDEQVARAVAASKIPIVSGVGHEIDFTLADFAADLRAPTPSAAAEQATPHIDALREAVRATEQQMRDIMRQSLDERQDLLAGITRALNYNSPEIYIRTMRQRIDAITSRMDLQHKARLTLSRERVKGRLAALEAANPQAILRRGYTMVRRADGTRVSSLEGVASGDDIVIQFADGEAAAQIKSTTPTPSGSRHETD